MPSIEWLPWNAESFARARAQGKPVLLSIATSWCGCCDEMDRTSYADPAVAALVSTRFVPVRVDADRRPDIGERYSLGGWPTTAFLTPDGEIVGGGTYIHPDVMPRVLQRVAEAFAVRQDEIATRASGPRDDAAPRPDEPWSADVLADGVFTEFDDEHGGFGTAPKYPLTAPIHLALDLYRESGDERWARIAARTLDAIGWGGLHDAADGGFFRCAAARDWRQPSRDKLLDVNARLLALFVHGAEGLGEDRFLDRAADVLRYVQNWLADTAEGGWAGSQRSREAPADLPAVDSRLGLVARAIDPALYTDWNASMVSAALRASGPLEDDGLRDFALKSLERVVLGCYRPGHGIAHYVLDGCSEVGGLLDDQVAMAAANLDAHEATGNITYEMMAEELVRYALSTLWDPEKGGFFDRADEPAAIGLLGRRLKPFVANCEAARVLRRLSVESGDEEFARAADATIAAIGHEARQQGPLAAHLLLALRERSLR